MISFSSEIVTDNNGKYRVVLKFNLTVSEYLKGSGPSSIVAVWVEGHSFDTSADAESMKTHVLDERDSQWDSREAVIFLYGEGSGFGTTLDNQIKSADHFLIYVGDPYSPDDFYSLHSRENKMWLPAASASSASQASSTSNNREFLLDVPSQTVGTSVGALGTNSSSTTPTITLGNLKKRIKEVTDEFNGGDGSGAYKQCVTEKYRFQRAIRYFREEKDRDIYDRSPQSSNVASGRSANTTIHQRQNYGYYPDTKAKVWLEGKDATLFSVVHSKSTSVDYDGDGTLTAGEDHISYTESFQAVRPLPAGEYKIDRKEVWIPYLRCNYALSFDWTVTVTAPVGAVHEAFFDPVNMTGGAIGADKDNGALKPTAFSVNGTATKIERVKWDPSGRVSMDLKPGVSLKGHLIEFIGLNGKPIRSLSFDRSVGTSSAPSWQVCDPPWKAGDLLMIRISAGATAFGEAAKVSPCPNAPTPTPTPKPPARGRG